MISIAEQKIVSIMNRKYGLDFRKRFEKLDEEMEELMEAKEQYVSDGTLKARDHIKEELADVMAVLTHLASLFDMSIDELLIEALLKIHIRDHNPKYLRNE